MTKRIWKYVLAGPFETTLDIPGEDVSVLSAAVQGDQVVVWCEVEPVSKANTRLTFRRVPTGSNEVPDNAQYVGTVTLPDATLPNGYVDHIYVFES